ncbi:MAG: hypothetical protein LBD38_02390 [Streptococcaceae bacterium]|jgi:uncharacterized HAD superfamily protein|nr:hypothetical protein [Streptococcaceae bacterium]
MEKKELLEKLKKEAYVTSPQHSFKNIKGVSATMQFLRDEEGEVLYAPRKKVMGYDLDGVIFSIKKAIELTNEKIGTSIKLDTMTAIDYEIVYYATMDDAIQKRIIKESMPNMRMVEDLAEEHLNGSEIVLITARHVDYANETIAALNKFGVYFDKLYFTEDKLPLIRRLGIDWFYDDKSETIQKIKETSKHTKAVLVSAPYNRDATIYDYRYKVGTI